MAKKIELLHTTYDESGNIESQEVVHPLTSPDCIIMENGKTLDEVMGDGIATPTLTHEGTSFKVGVGDSNIEVVDGDVAGMTLKGQSYQNILPKPTTLIMETDEKEFKINDKIDSNIIIDDNIAEIATVKGKTIVNAVQEESGNEYTVLGENLSGQSIVTTNNPKGNIKGVTLQGQTLVNTIQEPCKDDYVVLGAEDGIEIGAETGGCGTIENTVQGGINGAVLEGQTLVNLVAGISQENSHYTDYNLTYVDKTKSYLIKFNSTKNIAQVGFIVNDTTWNVSKGNGLDILDGYVVLKPNENLDITKLRVVTNNSTGSYVLKTMLFEYQEGMENWDIPYFEGMKSVQMPVLTTTGKNLFNWEKLTWHMNRSQWSHGGGGLGNRNAIGYQGTAGTVSDFNLQNDKTYFTNATISFYADDTFYQALSGTRTNTFIVPNNAQYVAISKKISNEAVTNITNPEIILAEGSTTTSYEPYKSNILTTGKLPLTSDMIEQGSFFDSFELNTQTYEYIKTPSTNTDFYANRIRSKATFKVHGGDKYIFNLNTDYTITLGFCKNGLYSAKNGSWITNGTIITVPSDCDEMFFAIRKTSYANIVPSEFSSVGLEIRHLVNLRKVGDVQDELDLTTGKLTQRIGEIVLDGTTYNFNQTPAEVIGDNVVGGWSGIYGINAPKKTTPSISSDIPTRIYTSDGNPYEDKEYFMVGINTMILSLSKTRLNGKTIAQYLQSNPITVQYELETPIIKTIDLQAIDQDSNTIPHIKTQPTVTHITASSYHLIPTVTIDNNLAYDTIIKPSTLYTVRFKRGNVNADNPLTIDLGGTAQVVTSTEFTITTPSELTHNQLVFSGKNNVVSEVQVIEGDVTNIEYPFFEGMNDVKFSDSKFIATGKNLLYIPSNVEMIGGYRDDVDISHSNGAITLSGKNPNMTTTEAYVQTNICAYLVAGKTYTVSFKSDGTPSNENGTDTVEMFLAWNNYYDSNNPYGKHNYFEIHNNTQIITPRLTGMYYLRLDLNLGSATHTFYDIQVEEGSVATSYEPYKGVEVQQDIDSIPLTSDMFEQNGFNLDNYNPAGFTMQQLNLWITPRRIKSKTLIKVKPNTKYIYNDSVIGYALFFDKNGLYVGRDNTYNSITTTHDTRYIIMCLQNPQDLTTETNISPSDLDSMNLILQEVPQEIVLRGIGDIKDELDLTRGEYIQRIGEIVLDGSAYWDVYRKEYHGVGKSTFQVYCTRDIPKTFLNDKIYCDILCQGDLLENGNANVNKYPCNYIHNYTDGTYTVNNRLFVSVNKEMFGCTSNDDYDTCCVRFKAWLQQNPITVQYKLATPIIHKVNLTNTKVIQSYATETHYETITPSDSLIPNITIPSTLNYDVAIKPSTEYTIRANTSDNLTVDLGGATGTLSNGKVTLTTPATLTHNEVKFSGTGKVKELMVVEGNEIKDNVPFFNGMKNVQMGGIKLVNVCRGMYTWNTGFITLNTNYNQITFTDKGSYGNIQFDETLLKSHTTYTVYFKITENTSTITSPIGVTLSQTNGKETSTYPIINAKQTGIMSFTITTDEVAKVPRFVVKSGSTDSKITIKNAMIIEGDWTHLDEIPYIESEMIIDQPIIRSQGKNLFDISRGINYTWHSEYTINGDGSVSVMPTIVDGVAYVQSEFFFLEVGKTYTVSWNASGNAHASFVWLAGTTNSPYGTSNTFTVVEGKNKLTLAMYVDTSSLENVATFKPQIEEGSTATSYEPFKHQTLYSNRVIGYEEGVHYVGTTGLKVTNEIYNSVMADVEGLSIAYVTNGSSNFTFWDKDGVYISGKSYLDTSLSKDNTNGFIQVPSNAKYMKFVSGNTTGSVTHYTKATVTGELPLRSLPNGVCDTLNLVTGEYVQNIKEVVIDGSEDWFIQEDNTKTEKTIYCRCISFPDNLPLPSDWDNNAYNVNLNCDNLTVYSSDYMWRNEVEGISRVQSSRHLRIRLNKNKLDTPDLAGFKQYLSQNPVTVQYQLETPIVRKLGFTTKGNYAQLDLDGETTKNIAQNPNEPNRYHITPFGSIATVELTQGLFDMNGNFIVSGVYSYPYTMYKYPDGSELVVLVPENIQDTKSCRLWLSQNPIKVGYITSAQSSESYSNIHKPIFFNNVNVQFLPYNLDIQPELTYQVRTRNSYVMDMMKPNTTYTMKCLAYSNSAKLYVANSSANTFVSSNKTLQFAQSHLDGSKNVLVLVGQWYEPMIIEGDVTGKNLPYFKGILSSYHDVDEIEVYSVNKNLFDMSKVKPYEGRATYWWNTIVKENEVVSVRIGDINNGQFGAYIKLDVRPNSVYTLYIEMEKDGEPFDGQIYGYENDDLWGNGTFSGYANTKHHLRTSHNAKYITIGFNYGKDFPIGTKLVAKNMRLYLGEESPVYIPHVHNSTLIEMPTRLETVKVVRPILVDGALDVTNGTEWTGTTNNCRTDFIPVEPKEFIHVRNGSSDRLSNILCYDINKNFICYLLKAPTQNGYAPENCYFIRLYWSKSNVSDLTITRQAWKPIQLNSLPNGVCDEIIMKPNSNKAQLVQRVGKVVLDGVYYPLSASASEVKGDDISCTYSILNNVAGGICQSDKLLSVSYRQDYKNIECIMLGTNSIVTSMLKTRAYNAGEYAKENPITVYYELATPIIHEIQLKGYPHVYENGTVTLNTDIPHQTLVSYNVNQEQLINTQNETIIRHDQQIDDLYYYIEMYLEEIYQTELFRMKLELSL